MKINKLLVIALIIISSLKSTAAQRQALASEILFGADGMSFQDTTFFKSYVAANKSGYLYSKPNLSSKTKVKLPGKTMITTINRVGKFEYGDFSVSSTKKYRGWFLITDLKSITLTPPANVKEE